MRFPRSVPSPLRLISPIRLFLFIALLALGLVGAQSFAALSAVAPPTNMHVTAQTQKTITVAWTGKAPRYSMWLSGRFVVHVAKTSYTFAGLKCGTKYDLGLRSVNGNSHSVTVTISASTAACPDITPPSAPSSFAASSITATAATATWNASTDNVGVAGYNIYQNGAKIATTTATMYTFSGLICDSSYSVAVSAFDAAGNTSPQTSMTVMTAACPDTTPPTTPSGLSPSGQTVNSIHLSWAASTDNVGVAGYNLYQDGSKVATTTGTSYTFSGLTCDKLYTLAAAAFDAAGNTSAQSSVESSTLACPDTIAPTEPSSFAASSATTSTIATTWTASTDNVAVAGYNLYANGIKVASTTATNYTFSDLTCGSSYSLAVAAFDAAGNVSVENAITASTEACVDTTPPSEPAGFTTSSIAATSVATKWTASTDNVGVAGYDLYKNGTKITATTGTTYTFTGLTCDTAYTLSVAAFDAAGNISPQDTFTVTTQLCPDTTPPSAPTSLSPSGQTTTGINLSWKASTDNVGVAGYNVYENGTKIGTTTATSYSFTGLNCGTTYTLAVSAYDAAGNTSSQTAAQGSTLACPVSGGTNVVNFNRFTYQYSSTYSINQEAHLYTYMNLQSSDVATEEQLRAANPNLVVTAYLDSRNTRSGDPTGITTCVPYDVASSHPDWFLHDSSGNVISYPGAGGSVYPMDVSNSGYQAECAAHALAVLGQGTWSGVFYDEVDARYEWTFPNGESSVEYPNDTAWQQGLTSLLAYMYPIMKAHGYVSIGNLGGTTYTPGLWQTWNTYLDGAMEESWTDGGDGTAQQLSDWPAKLSQAAWSEANHKLTILHSYNTTEVGNTYGLASMLLIADGESSYSVSPSYNQSGMTSSSELWFPEYTTAQGLGAPSGAYMKLSNGVYERVFANGIVLVNPTSSSVSNFSLGGGTYSGSGLTNVTSVSMASATGLILLRTS